VEKLMQPPQILQALMAAAVRVLALQQQKVQENPLVKEIRKLILEIQSNNQQQQSHLAEKAWTEISKLHTEQAEKLSDLTTRLLTLKNSYSVESATGEKQRLIGEINEAIDSLSKILSEMKESHNTRQLPRINELKAYDARNIPHDARLYVASLLDEARLSYNNQETRMDWLQGPLQTLSRLINKIEALRAQERRGLGLGAVTADPAVTARVASNQPPQRRDPPPPAAAAAVEAARSTSPSRNRRCTFSTGAASRAGNPAPANSNAAPAESSRQSTEQAVENWEAAFKILTKEKASSQQKLDKLKRTELLDYIKRHNPPHGPKKMLYNHVKQGIKDLPIRIEESRLMFEITHIDTSCGPELKKLAELIQNYNEFLSKIENRSLAGSFCDDKDYLLRDILCLLKEEDPNLATLDHLLAILKQTIPERDLAEFLADREKNATSSHQASP